MTTVDFFIVLVLFLACEWIYRLTWLIRHKQEIANLLKDLQASIYKDIIQREENEYLAKDINYRIVLLQNYTTLNSLTSDIFLFSKVVWHAIKSKNRTIAKEFKFLFAQVRKAEQINEHSEDRIIEIEDKLKVLTAKAIRKSSIVTPVILDFILRMSIYIRIRHLCDINALSICPTKESLKDELRNRNMTCNLAIIAFLKHSTHKLRRQQI